MTAAALTFMYSFRHCHAERLPLRGEAGHNWHHNCPTLIQIKAFGHILTSLYPSPAQKEDAMKTNESPKSEAYVRPTMRTVVTPTEIRDIDQPCAFYAPGERRKKNKPK
ncbi:MAG: hypothetical protein HC829_02395 [Bacteroidales bacterium]|nr:hypothetical protein [Bacteroidales bacterium]